MVSGQSCLDDLRHVCIQTFDQLNESFPLGLPYGFRRFSYFLDFGDLNENIKKIRDSVRFVRKKKEDRKNNFYTMEDGFQEKILQILPILYERSVRRIITDLNFLETKIEDEVRSLERTDARRDEILRARDVSEEETISLTVEMLEWINSITDLTDRQIISMHIEGYSSPEIAKELNIPERTIRHKIRNLKNF